MNSLKVPKIKKILLYEMKFLVPNYSCLQNPWLGGYRPPDPRSLCPLSSTEFVEPPRPPPEQNSWVPPCFPPNTAKCLKCLVAPSLETCTVTEQKDRLKRQAKLFVLQFLQLAVI